MTQLLARTSVVFVAVFCVASSAWAQNPRVRGPFAGLFGGGPQVQNSQTLDLRASLFGVWQDVVVPPDFDRSLLDPRFETSGTFGGAVGSLGYGFDRHSPTSALFVNALAWTAEYSVTPDEPQYGVDAHGGFSHNVNLTRRMTWASSATASYSPYFTFGTLGGAPLFDPNALPSTLTPGLGLLGVSATNITATATTGIRQALARHSTLAANLSLTQVHFLSESDGDLTQVGSNVVFIQQLFRKLNFHVGYSVAQSRTVNPPTWTGPTQNLDLGLDYGDSGSFQLTRRTTLSLSGALGSARTVPGQTQYRILGSADLVHTFGRSWVGHAGASRGLGFVAAFQQPVLYDSATASLAGQLFNRVSWTSSTGWSRGYIGLDQSKHYDTLFASSGLSYGVTHWMGAFAQYTYYRTRVPAGSTALSVLTNFDRQTATVGVSLFTPLYRSRRTTS